MKAKLQYHGDALHLLDRTPRFSRSASDELNSRERELGITFPESFREWYSLERAVSLIQSGRDDSVLATSELGLPFKDWYGGGPKDFVAENLLLFMQENQGVCNWAIRLNGTPDPPVVVEVDTAPCAVWLRCADTFSTFVWCQIWDLAPARSISVSAQVTELSRSDFRFLKAQFVERPKTYGWPGKVNYRFEAGESRILIWDGEDRGVDWMVWSRTAKQLQAVLKEIWHCGELSQQLYAMDDRASNVLATLRRE